MKDSDSYEHVETRYNDMGNHFIVFTKFRGTNSFGGVVTNIVKAKVALNEDIVEVLEGL